VGGILVKGLIVPVIGNCMDKT